jgi:hypothetical protein
MNGSVAWQFQGVPLVNPANPNVPILPNPPSLKMIEPGPPDTTPSTGVLNPDGTPVLPITPWTLPAGPVR